MGLFHNNLSRGRASTSNIIDTVFKHWLWGKLGRPTGGNDSGLPQTLLPYRWSLPVVTCYRIALDTNKGQIYFVIDLSAAFTQTPWHWFCRPTGIQQKGRVVRKGGTRLLPLRHLRHLRALSAHAHHVHTVCRNVYAGTDQECALLQPICYGEPVCRVVDAAKNIKDKNKPHPYIHCFFLFLHTRERALIMILQAKQFFCRLILHCYSVRHAIQSPQSRS